MKMHNNAAWLIRDLAAALPTNAYPKGSVSRFDMALGQGCSKCQVPCFSPVHAQDLRMYQSGPYMTVFQ